MKEDILKLAQQEIDEALAAVENIESNLSEKEPSRDDLKEKFIKLNEKVNELENLLKSQGII